ncbi:MAG: hypothetical protein NTZ60_01285 [Campylobacterales bacterium]|nr:hypothetical protein [Campylobacterales bacterium]
MTDYESELEYFQNLYFKMNQCSECALLKSYLFELLDLNTINEIIGYYTATKKDNIILKNFEEEEMQIYVDVCTLKKKLVSCFVNELLTKYNQENFSNSRVRLS